MSIEQAKAFMAEVGRNPELKEEVAALSGREALRDMVALAAQRGYHFDEAEYREAVVDHARESLSDEALEALAREMGLQQEPPSE